jgi:hypothetical protein
MEHLMTTITNPAAPTFQAILLKSHLKLFALGMKNSRMSGKDMLSKASAITHVEYKRGQYALAIADLAAFIEENNRG